MNIVRAINWLYNGKEAYYRWQVEASRVEKVGLALLMAAITGIFAQIRIHLPWTPVPITGQVFAVLLSGLLLGGFYAGLSMVFYLTFGALGLPWFANFRAGLSIGPTLGYLIGFIPAAIFVGIFAQKNRRLVAQVGFMMLAVAIIYLFGSLNFSLVMNTDLSTTLKMAVLPFIPLDIGKAVLAALASKVILPDEKY